jgi:putative glutamine amidotransferase
MEHPKRAVIGITTYGENKDKRFHLPREYVDTVRLAGGVPILLTPGEENIAQIFDLVDGIIFTGGGDIDPALYGQALHEKTERIDPERDRFEMALAEYVVTKSKPVLGICRGIQLLNVATGGDLIQHLPDVVGKEVLHLGDNGDETEHEVSLKQQSRLKSIIENGVVKVRSKHHQGLGKISEDWEITGHAGDGSVEALEHKKHPWMMAVLWHPELAANDPDNQKIIRALVEAARRKK